MIAIGAQRLLPLIQQLFLSWANLRSGMGSLDSVLEVLTLPGHSFQNCNDVKRIGFAGSIELKNVSYRYEDGSDDYVLKDISLKINKGDSIGFVGKTGSGKSTLTDLIMGLIKPTIGTLAVDNKQIDSDNLCSWYKSISHVPQDVFLIDASISENIAFGVEGQNISNKRIVQAAKEALIHDVINKLPDKYQTKAGERGVKLSGGQKQRIAIARALYKRSDLLILDEATSALDDHTEKNLLDTIHNLESNLTTIHVAHRINTISSCNRIIRIEDGRIDFDGSYEEYLRMIN